MKYMRIILFLFMLLFGLFSPLPVLAQNPPGISVTPSILRIDLNTEPSEFELIYKNNSQSEISLELSATDFSELEDGWKVRFLTDEESKNYHYSLASWIEFERKSLSLKPEEEGRIKVLVNKDELSPGGHYGSIQAAISSLEESGEQVAIRGLLSTILFVRTSTGKEIEQASISDLIVNRPSLFHFPQLFTLRFNNQGNTELMPFGSLEIKDLLGRTVAKGVLNEGSNYSLPESIKRFEIRSNLIDQLVIPGIYRAQLEVTYGKSGILKYETTFIYLHLVSLIMALLLMGLLGIGGKILIKKMKQDKTTTPLITQAPKPKKVRVKK